MALLPTPAPQAQPLVDPAWLVVLAGVCAALHVGKLPPAIPVLQAALSISLVQAGFLLAIVQGAGMAAGVAFGALADALTPRRSLLTGLSLLTLASALGGFAPGVLMLMALRLCEGFGFLLVVLAAPALLRTLVPAQRLQAMIGVWGAYMPLATTLALLAGPWVLQAAGWRAWWWLLAAMTAAMALWAACAVPAGTRHSGGATAPGALPLKTRLVRTLSAPAPWLLALAFATYAGQWLAVIGFLPTIYAQGGTALASAGLLAAAAAGVNIIGNVAAGRLLQAGVSPVKLLATGFVAMGFCACVAFVAFAVSPADVPQAAPQPWFPPLLRFAAVLLFSGFGGLIPATLFALAVRAAPGEGTLSTTVGWLQQWSAIGQFVGPPLVAWLAARAGGWHLTWLATGASSLVGCVLVALIGRELARLERLRAAAHGGA